MTALTEIFVPVRPDMDTFPKEVAAKLRRIDGKKEGDAVGGRFGVGMSKSFSGLGGKLTGSFRNGLSKLSGVALAGGALAGAAITTGLKSALEQGNVKAKFEAQLDLSGPAAQKAGKLAGDLFKSNYGESLGGVNDAIASVVQNTNVSLDSIDLKSVTAKVLDLTSVFDQDLAKTTAGVGNLMRNGLAKNATEALDIVTRGFQSGVNKSDDFLDTLNEYGPQFRKFGIDGKTATGLLSQGLKAGARDADTVADAIKEFSIRAIDGSTGTAAGFKALGLDAKAMSEQIAKGGKPASDGLQLVLDKLRGIKDPVKQQAAAVALFGTKAEDLGKSLFALDPSKAVDALGQVAGAADRLDEKVGKTPQAAIAGFFRTLKQGAIESFGGVIQAFASGETSAKGFQGFLENAAVIGRQAFDKIKDGAVSFGKAAGPKLQEFGEFVKTTIVPAVLNLVDAFRPLAADVGTAVSGAFAIIVPMLKDLGGFISTTLVPAFADFTKWLKDNSTVVGALVVGIGAMVLAVQAYTLAMNIGAAAVKAYTVVTTILDKVMKLSTFGIIITLVIGLAAALVYAYQKSETFRNIVNGVWNAVSTAAQVAFDWIKNAAETVFNWFVTGWSIVDKILTAPFTLAQAAIGIVWAGIKLAAQTVYSWFVTGWSLIQAVITKPFELAKTAIDTAWTAVKTAAQGALAWVVKKFLDFAQTIIDTAAKAFGWVPNLGDKLSAAATEFGKFRDSVNTKLGGINDQEVKVTADLKSWGTPELLAAAHGRAKGGPGGPVHGPGSTTSDTAGLFALSNKEWVIKAASSQMYGDRAMKSVNDGTAMIVPGYAKGGSPGVRVASSLPSERQQQQAMSGVSGAVAAIGREMAPVMAKIMEKALGINPALNKVLDYVRSQVGKPYVWGGVGPGGYDCSGLVSAAVNVARGKSPNSRVGATGSMPWAGMVAGPGAFEIGWFQGNPGHTAATVNKVNIESAGGVGVRMGSGARGARDAMFTNRAHLKGFAGGGSVGQFLRRFAPSRHELHLQHLAHLAHAEHLSHLAHLLTGGTEGGFIGARARVKGDAPFDLLDPRGSRFLGKRALRDLGIEDFDTGGRWRSGTLGVNLSGKTETVLPADGVMTVALSNEDRRLLRSVRDRAITLDGRRIDEAFGRGALGGGY